MWMVAAPCVWHRVEVQHEGVVVVPLQHEQTQLFRSHHIMVIVCLTPVHHRCEARVLGPGRC
jgi:hypothetical protein